MALTNKLSAIADAIRSKTGGTHLLTLDQMPEAIRSIETGSGDSGSSGSTDGSLWDLATETNFISNRFGIENVALPENIKTIEDYAFHGCQNLRITLPDTIEEIGIGAFFYCREFDWRELPNNITKLGGNAFQYCTNLALAKLPDALTDLGTYTFQYCNALAISEIPIGVTSLNNYVFSYCKGITDMTLHSGITSLKSNAFGGCENLATVTFLGTPQSISWSAFNNCTNLTTINVPWAEGEVADAPWGATNATINYNYTA